MEIQLFKHSTKKFSLLCCRLLDSFNKNVPRETALDKYLLERFLVVPTFFRYGQDVKKGALPQTLKSIFSNIFQNSSCLVPV